MQAKAVRRAGVALSVAALLGVLGACSSGEKPPAPKSSSSAKPTLPAPSAASSASPSASPSASSAAGAQSLGGECATILPLSDVERAIGGRVVGRTAFVVNLPDAKAGMLARINCRYGIGKAVIRKKKRVDPAPKIEVSVSLYSTAAQAAGRVTDTVQSWRDSGARQSTITTNGDTATLLLGYGQPLLVVAHGQRTVAVSVQAVLLKGKNAASVMSQIAAKAIANSGE